MDIGVFRVEHDAESAYSAARSCGILYCTVMFCAVMSQNLDLDSSHPNPIAPEEHL